MAKRRMSEPNKTLNTLGIHLCGEKGRGKAAVFQGTWEKMMCLVTKALRNLNTGNDRSWLHPEIGCDHILVFPQLKIKTKRQ